MKAKAIIAGILAAGAFMINSSAQSQSFETAEQAVSHITAGWNLGNTLDSTGEWIVLYSDGKPDKFETAWGNPAAARELITAVKKEGFNAVRVPVTWEYHIDGKGNINKEWLDRVQQVVDYVISQDMYCVLNVHHDAGADGWLEASADCFAECSGRFAALWSGISERFADYGEKLIFESFNEMLDKQDSWGAARETDAYKSVNDFNALFVKTVRASGGNNRQRNLMLQTYAGSCSAESLEGFVLPTDSVKDHLIIQVHNYDPEGFTSSSATWTTMTDKWGTDREKLYFDDLFSRLGDFSARMKAPLVVGEYGADNKDNDSDRAAYAAYFVGTAAKYGIKCFWWDTGGMGLFDRNTASATHPDIISAIVNNVPKSVTKEDIINIAKAAALLGYAQLTSYRQ